MDPLIPQMRTLYVFGAVVCALAALAFELRSPMSGRRSYGLRYGPAYGTLGFFSLSIAFLLLTQRGIWHPVLTTVLADAMVLLAPGLFYAGLEGLRDERPNWFLAAIPPAAVLVMFPLIGLGDGAYGERFVLLAVLWVVAFLPVLYSMWQDAPAGQLRSRSVITVAIVGVTAVVVWHALGIVGDKQASLFSQTGDNLLFYAGAIGFLILGALGALAFISSQRKSRQ